MATINPFLLSGYIDHTYFCDREFETSHIVSALSNNRNITLTSIRRLGKTGLIKHIFYHLKDSSFRLIYLDILSTQSLPELIRALGNAIIADEKAHSKDYLKKIAKLIAGIKARLVFDGITGSPTIEIGYTGYQEAEIGIGQIFEYLTNQKANYIIAIDEFQQITNYPEKNVEAVLRSHIQHLTNVSFLYSGSNKHILTSMFSNYGRPFYQSTDFVQLKRIDKDVYADFIIRKFTENKRKIDRNDVLDIINCYDTYTLYVQSYFNRLFATNEKKITPLLMEKIKTTVLEEREYVFYSYQNLLTNSQFDLLKALAKVGGTAQPTSKQFMKVSGLSQPSSVTRSLKSLLDKEMIYQEDNIYKVYDVFFAKWLERK